MTAKEHLKQQGLKNPPLDSGISGCGDAPRRYASQLMEEWAAKCLSHHELQDLDELKTVHYLNAHFVDDPDSLYMYADELRREFESEYNMAMDMFISGYRLAKKLPDFGDIDLLSNFP